MTDATEVKAHSVMQGRQIVGETHGTQPTAKLEPHPSHRFNAKSLLEVSITPSNGVLDSTKHSVMFQESGTLGEKQEEHLTHKNAMG